MVDVKIVRPLVRMIAKALVDTIVMILAQVVLLVEDVQIAHRLVVQMLQAVYALLAQMTVLLHVKNHANTHVLLLAKVLQRGNQLLDLLMVMNMLI